MNAKEPLLERLAELQRGIDDCCKDDAIPVDDWYYRIRVTTFTSVGLFSERDDGFSFLTPFVNIELLRWMFSLPDEIKTDPRFYRDVVALDGDIASMFRFPLKNLKGAGYFAGTWTNTRSIAHYAWRAWRCGVRPMQNYANYERMYPDAFLLGEVSKASSLKNSLDLNLGLPIWGKLNYAQRALLVSLGLHLDSVFKKGAFSA